MPSETPLPESPTLRAHKRQFTWQILAPVLLVTALILAAASLLLVGFGDTARNRLFADVSIIWLIVPLLLLAFGFLAVLGGLIYALAKLLAYTPRITGKAQHYAALGSAGARRLADLAVKPILWLGGLGGILEAFFKPASKDKK
jgi:hypothetical protein